MSAFVLFFCLIAIFAIAAAQQHAYLISSDDVLYTVDACGQFAATNITGKNLVLHQDVVYFENDNRDLMRFVSVNQTEVVCEGCVPLTRWTVYDDGIFGWGETKITRTSMLSGFMEDDYTSDNVIQAATIVNDIVYWIELTSPASGERQLWSANYPAFSQPTSNTNGVILAEYLDMAVNGEVVLMYGPENAEQFTARDSPLFSVRDRTSINVPLNDGTLVGVSAADRSFVYVTSGGLLTETFTGQCLRNITSVLPGSINSIATLSATTCPEAQCVQATTTGTITATTTTSAAYQLLPNIQLIFVVVFALVLVHFLFD